MQSILPCPPENHKFQNVLLQICFEDTDAFFSPSGFHRNSEEKGGLLEAAGPQTVASVPSESNAGHARVPTERVSSLLLFISFFSTEDVTPADCKTPCTYSFCHIFALILFLFSPPLSPHSINIILHDLFSAVEHAVVLKLDVYWFIFFCSYTSWAYGSNSLPTAGSVSGGVGRRGQRQFQMTPRGLPAGRMGLLSPSGIGGASPRHTLTNPALAGQGRQVSIPDIELAF